MIARHPSIAYIRGCLHACWCGNIRLALRMNSTYSLSYLLKGIIDPLDEVRIESRQFDARLIDLARARISFPILSTRISFYLVSIIWFPVLAFSSI